MVGKNSCHAFSSLMSSHVCAALQSLMADLDHEAHDLLTDFEVIAL